MSSSPTAVTTASGHSANLTPIEFNGQRVITLAMMDRAHQRPEGTARKRFNDHRGKLSDGIDYFTLTQPSEIRTVGLARADGSTPASVIILTESGYLLLVKSFTDDLAWQVQRELVNGYFRTSRPQPAAQPVAELSRMEILKLAMASEEARLKAESALAVAAPKAAAHDRLAAADGSMCVTNAAKHLKMRPKDLFSWLSAHRWIYKRAGTSVWLGYQDRIQAGLVEHTTTTVERTDGTEKVVENLRITAKGIARLAAALEVQEEAA